VFEYYKEPILILISLILNITILSTRKYKRRMSEVSVKREKQNNLSPFY